MVIRLIMKHLKTFDSERRKHYVSFNQLFTSQKIQNRGKEI